MNKEDIVKLIEDFEKTSNKKIEEIVDDYNFLVEIQNKVKNIVENYRIPLILELKDREEKSVDLKGNFTNLRSTRVDSYSLKQDDRFKEFKEKFEKGEYRKDILHSIQITLENDNIKKILDIIKDEKFEVSKESWDVINKEYAKNKELEEIVNVNHSYRFKKIK